jgi:hypothetical protein
MALHRDDEPFVRAALKRPDLHVCVVEGDYIAKHRDSPKGARCWQFRVGPLMQLPAGELVGFSEPIAYEDARAFAQRYAASLWRERGFCHVYVVP